MNNLGKLEELQEQIKKLQEQEKALISEAREGVIKEMREKISRFKLTAADLGFAVVVPAPPPVKTVSKPKKAVSQAIAEATDGSEATYKGPNGELWTRKRKAGRPPGWVTKITKEGGNIEDYRVASVKTS